MPDYEESTYGDMWAPIYDDVWAEFDESTIDFLEGYAGTPPRALELAIGSGRIALPLATRGVDVSGIDISERMVQKMRDKPGGGTIPVVMGDFADVEVDGTFPLIYLVFNTIFALLTQERQVECFRNVADHLEPGGRFVIECFVPNMKRFDDHNTRMAVSNIKSTSEHSYEMSIHKPDKQRISTHLVMRREDGEKVLPVEIRYAWPSELDLMAQLAGLEREGRWGGFDMRPYTERSISHVTAYRKPH